MDTFKLSSRLLVLLIIGVTFAAPARGDDTVRFRAAGAVRPFANSAFASAATDDGRQYAVAGRRGTIVVYDAATHNERFRVEHPDGMVLALAYSRPESCLLAAGDPRRLRVLARDEPRLLREIDLPYRCGFLAAHPTLPVAALCGRTPSEGDAAGASKQVLFVNLRTGRLLGGLAGSFRRGFQLAFSSDGQTLYVVAEKQYGDKSRYSVLKVSTAGLSDRQFVPEQPAYRPLHESATMIRNMALAPDDKYLAVMNQSEVVLIELARQSEAYRWPGECDRGNVLSFWDARHLIASGKQQWRVYRVDALEPLHVQPDQDSSSANALIRLHRSNTAISSHTRADNQLVRWQLTGLAEMGAVNPGDGLGPLMTDNSPAKPLRPQAAGSKPGGAAKGDDREASQPGRGRPNEPGDSHDVSGGRGRIRTWTQASSGRTLKAIAIGFDDNQLLLARADGRELVVPIAALSKDDQAHCKELFPAIAPSPTAFEDADLLLDSPATMALAPQLSLAADDADWLVEAIGSERPLRALKVWSTRPNGRGGSWLATELGLAEHEPELGRVTLRALSPDISAFESTPLPTDVSALEVDRFGRPIVCWGREGSAFRWNGLRWTFLVPPRGMKVRGLARAGKDVFAALVGATASGLNVAKLEGTEWTPIDVRIDGKRLDKVERLLGSPKGHLIGIRRDDAPVRIEGAVAVVLEARQLDMFGLESSRGLLGPMPKATVATDGRVYFVRQGRDGRAKLFAVGDRLEPWEIKIEGMERPNVLGVASDRSNRLWLHVAPSQAERAEQIVSAGKFVPSNAGVFLQKEGRWVRMPTDLTSLPTVLVDRGTDRSPGVPWICYPKMAPFVAPRTWRTADGKHTVRAECIELDESAVTLRSSDRIVKTPRNLLDEVDQRFLQHLERHLSAEAGDSPTIRRVSTIRTAGDSFFNENWKEMLKAGEIFPKIEQAAGPQQHPTPKDHLWVIDSTRNVAKWEAGRLAPTPPLTTDAVAEPQTPSQLVVDNQGQVFVVCVDGRVRRLSGDRWEVLDRGIKHNLVVQRLKVVSGRLLALVGSASALQRAKGAAPSRLSGVLQLVRDSWQPIILMDRETAGSVRDVVGLPPSPARPAAERSSHLGARAVVSWTTKRLTVCDLDRSNPLSTAEFGKLPQADAELWHLAISDGILYGLARTNSVRCLFDERTGQFDLAHANWDSTGRNPPQVSLQVDQSGTIWQWSGRLLCRDGNASRILPTEGERPQGMQLVGDRYLVLWGSHLSLYEILRN